MRLTELPTKSGPEHFLPRPYVRAGSCYEAHGASHKKWPRTPTGHTTKSPATFYGMNNRVIVLIYHFSISLTMAVLQRQKSQPDIGGTIPFKMSAAWLPWDSPWSLASTL